MYTMCFGTWVDVIGLVFGTLSLAMVIAGWIFSCMGILLSMLIESTTRKPLDTRTPVEFDWIFFIKDNMKRIILALLLTFLIMRFSSKFLGEDATMWIGAICGIATDLVALSVKKFVRKYVKTKLNLEEREDA